MIRVLSILFLVSTLVACKSFEAKDNVTDSAASLGSSGPTPTPIVVTTPTPTPEPALPEKASVDTVGAVTFAQVKQMSLSGSRPDAVKADLDACFTRMTASITYDSIGIVPLMPDASPRNVDGDVIIDDAGTVSGGGIGGSVTVKRAELVDMLSNLTGATASSKITARLTNSIVNVDGQITVDSLAILSLQNVYNNVNASAHAIGTLDGGAATAQPSVVAPKVCLFSQEVEGVSHVGGKLVMVGRGENGDFGQVKIINNLTGSVISVGMAVGEVQNLTLAASEYLYLESSNTGKISGDMAGVVYLNGSKVDSLQNIGGGQTTVYLMNGAAVATVAGNVKLVEVK